MNPFENQYPNAAKKFFLQLLPENIAQTHWNIIERICDDVRHEKDYKQLAAMLVAMYEVGFIRSIEEHKKGLENAGIEVEITAPTPALPNIFK